MTQKSIKIFINEIYSKSPKRNYITNKTDVNHIDDIWSLDILDLKDYGPESNRAYRYVLVIIDSFSNLGWTVPLKNKNAQTIKDSFENNLITSKRSPALFETDRSKKFYNKNFQDFLKKTISKFILEIVNMMLFLQNAFIVLLEISLKKSFSNKVMLIGLMYYLQ